MQGLHAEINNYFSKSVQNYIVTSRAVQGEREMLKSTPEEREDIIKRWNNIKFDLKNFYVMKRKEKSAGKQPATQPEEGVERPRTGWKFTRNMTFDERKKLQAQRQAWKKGYVDTPVRPPSSGSWETPPRTPEDEELEKAIQASVRETSRGDAEEDAIIEAAIRESVRAIQQRSESVHPIPEVAEKDPTIFDDAEYQITDEEYQALVEQAIQQSIATDRSLPQESGISELDAMGTPVRKSSDPPPPPPRQDEDADLQRAIEESKHVPPPNPQNDEEEELRRAIEESRHTVTAPARDADDEKEFLRAIEASKEAMEKEKSQRTEEEIVMEYVKKQSLAEEEYRKQMAKGKGVSDESEDEDEQLRRAMEESLKLSRGDDAGPSRM